MNIRIPGQTRKKLQRHRFQQLAALNPLEAALSLWEPDYIHNKYVCTWFNACIYVNMCTCISVSVYISIHIYIYMYINIDIYIYVCIHIYTYIYMHKHTHINTHSNTHILNARTHTEQRALISSATDLSFWAPDSGYIYNK